LEFWPLERLIPSPRNARTHSEAQVAEIAGSIRTFGFTNPILVGEDGDVIAGHGRLAAARQLGLAEVPVIPLKGLTELQRRQLVLADNRIALNAGWDLEMLHLELRDLSSLGADLSMLGFTSGELAAALRPVSTGLTDENDVPPVAERAVATTGDVWCLGPHRLICGDSTDAGVVRTVLGSDAPQLMVTDPPYGVNYDPAWRDEAAKHSPSMGNRKDTAKGKVANDDRADWREAWALFPGDVAYVWHAGVMAARVAESLAACGFEIRSQIVWAKSHLAIGRSHYHWQHEPCWYAVKAAATGHWVGDRKQTTLWQIDKPQKSETGHGTQKPIECMRRPMPNNSSLGQAVYDPFLGSGTTLIAAETTGRVCLAVEIDPLYIDVAVRRWQAFTGCKAALGTTGRPFDDIARERLSTPAPAPRCENGRQRDSAAAPCGSPSGPVAGGRQGRTRRAAAAQEHSDTTSSRSDPAPCGEAGA
jgi:DNA modification methylase